MRRYNSRFGRCLLLLHFHDDNDHASSAGRAGCGTCASRGGSAAWRGDVESNWPGLSCALNSCVRLDVRPTTRSVDAIHVVMDSIQRPVSFSYTQLLRQRTDDTGHVCAHANTSSSSTRRGGEASSQHGGIPSKEIFDEKSRA